MNLSTTDLRLLEEMQRDCRQSLKELSRKLKLPMSTVHGKLKKFEQEGVIKGYSATIDAEKIGDSVTAFVLVQVAGTETSKIYKPRDVCDRIAKLPYVLETHVITGQYDIIIKIKGRTMKEIGNLLMDHISVIPGIRNTQTLEAFHSAKESLAFDLNPYSKPKQGEK